MSSWDIKRIMHLSFVLMVVFGILFVLDFFIESLKNTDYGEFMLLLLAVATGFTFGYSIKHLKTYKEKTFARVALVISSIIGILMVPLLIALWFAFMLVGF